ncbi:MAG TPA: hypothetical protein EYO58_08055 [Flavobacteriales bacterium]|nr:hypothetical protein [Flavobacteriales bacterium]
MKIKKYRLPIKVQRGPSTILNAINEEDESVILDLKEYCSPNGCMTNKLLTPKYMGHTKIIISTIDGELIFEENDSILII